MIHMSTIRSEIDNSSLVPVLQMAKNCGSLTLRIDYCDAGLFWRAQMKLAYVF